MCFDFFYHIVALENGYQLAGLAGYKCGHKLKDVHVNPDGFQKMRVCYAVQVKK